MHRFCAMLLAGSLFIIPAPADETGFVSMFNGKDLDGWDGKPGGWWVEDGALTSQSTKEKPCKKHHYLTWKGGEPADFILRLKSMRACATTIASSFPEGEQWVLCISPKRANRADRCWRCLGMAFAKNTV